MNFFQGGHPSGTFWRPLSSHVQLEIAEAEKREGLSSWSIE
jgi:hypothetical protein